MKTEDKCEFCDTGMRLSTSGARECVDRTPVPNCKLHKADEDKCLECLDNYELY